MESTWKKVGFNVDLKDLRVGKFYSSLDDIFEFVFIENGYVIYKPILGCKGFAEREDGLIGFADWSFPDQEVVKV